MKIIIGAQPNIFGFELKETEPIHSGYLTFSVSLSAHGLTGNHEDIQYSVAALNDFIDELTNLEATRQGEANLLHASHVTEHCPCRLKIFSLNRLGHMAIHAELLKTNSHPIQHTSKVTGVFEFEPGSLASILEDFQQLRSL